MSNRFFGLPKAKELLESAVRLGEKESKYGKKHLNKFVQLRKEHLVKIKTINTYLNKQFAKSLESFPSFDSMSGFQNEMIATFIEVNDLKKLLSHLNKLKKLINAISRKYTSIIYKGKNEKIVISSYKQYLGRIFSFEKDLDKSILKLNRIIYDLNKIPNIGEQPSIILAGFPNTGKTTILSRLTKSKPKIAAYAFTTQDLMLGTMEIHYNKIQLIDTPGLLDKTKEKRNKIEQKTINALKHLAGAIFFVIDPTPQCGFSLEKQLQLLEQLKEFYVPIIVIVNKADAATPEEINRIKINNPVIITGNGKEQEFREEIIEQIKKLKIF